MKELDFLKKNEWVKAPEDFEQSVMTLISRRKKKKEKVRVFRLSLVGAAATLGVIMLIFNFLLLKGDKSLEFVERGQVNIQDSENYYRFGEENRIPITEEVDYSGEIRERVKQPQTIYILEQVLDSTDTHIKY
ncbi:MAG: hypothetical protein ACOC5G_02875 [Acidobacteriota bacterium]